MVFHTALNENFHRHTRPYFLFLATLPEPRVEFANAGLQGPKLDPTDQPAALHQALIFAATKHRVEYLLSLLTVAGYALSLSHVYGSLDQAARTHQIDKFRRGNTNVLVVNGCVESNIECGQLRLSSRCSRLLVHSVCRAFFTIRIDQSHG